MMDDLGPWTSGSIFFAVALPGCWLRLWQGGRFRDLGFLLEMEWIGYRILWNY